MKEVTIKVNVPQSKEEVTVEAKKYWQKLCKIVDCTAEVIAETIKKGVNKNA